MQPNIPPDSTTSSRYLVAVSGGRDSVALLHWLKEHGFSRLVVCHLDHGLRGRASAADAEFVRRMAAKWKFPAEIERVDVRELARTTKQSLETAGRAARLDFFSRVARRRRCRTIFLAHHADDQVETFLLRLFRGAGGRGLGAIRSVSQIGDLQILRPFLSVWRSEIDDYICSQALKFREDATNATVNPRRNLLRHKIIPRLEKELGHHLRQNLWRTANLLADEDALLDQLTPNELTDDENNLPAKELCALAPAVQRRVILRWLRAGQVRDVGYEEVEKVRGLLASDGRAAKINLPDDRHARRRSGKIFLE